MRVLSPDTHTHTHTHTRKDRGEVGERLVIQTRVDGAVLKAGNSGGIPIMQAESRISSLGNLNLFS